MSPENLIGNLLAIDRPFERVAHIRVVERLLRHVHREDVVPIARDLGDLDARILLQHIERVEIGAADPVHLASGEGIHACPDIAYGEEFHLVEIGLAGLVVIRIALELGPDAGIPRDEAERTRAHVRLPVRGAVGFRGHNRDMVVAGNVRKISVSPVQGEDHGVLAIRLDVGDRREDRLHGRFRVLAHVVPVGGDHIVGC